MARINQIRKRIDRIENRKAAPGVRYWIRLSTNERLPELKPGQRLVMLARLGIDCESEWREVSRA